MPGYVQVQVAVGDRSVAEAIARVVVSAGLAACAQIVGPVTSVYRWKGEMETAEEHLLLVKSTRERSAALTARIRAEHPYETPEIIVLPVEGGLDAYLRWIEAETRATSARDPREPSG